MIYFQRFQQNWFSRKPDWKPMCVCFFWPWKHICLLFFAKKLVDWSLFVCTSLTPSWIIWKKTVWNIQFWMAWPHAGYCWWKKFGVHQLRLVGLSHYLQGLHIPGGQQNFWTINSSEIRAPWLQDKKGPHAEDFHPATDTVTCKNAFMF